MPLRLISDALAQSTIPLALTNVAVTFVAGASANFTQPQNFGGGVARITILDAGNGAFNPAAPLATNFEYIDYTNNNTGTNTISGITRGVAGSTAHAFSAGAVIAQGFLVEDILASTAWKFDHQTPTGIGTITIPASGTIPASYLGTSWQALEIMWHARTTSGNNSDVMTMTHNGDNTANYDTFIQDLGGTYAQNSILGGTSMRPGVIAGGTLGAGLFNSGRITIWNYGATGARRPWVSEVFRNDIASGVGIYNGAWRNTANAITSITLAAAAGNFASGSWFATRLIP
jgi:hypothetical protein